MKKLLITLLIVPQLIGSSFIYAQDMGEFKVVYKRQAQSDDRRDEQRDEVRDEVKAEEDKKLEEDAFIKARRERRAALEEKAEKEEKENQFKKQCSDYYLKEKSTYLTLNKLYGKDLQTKAEKQIAGGSLLAALSGVTLATTHGKTEKTLGIIGLGAGILTALFGIDNASKSIDVEKEMKKSRDYKIVNKCVGLWQKRNILASFKEEQSPGIDCFWIDQANRFVCTDQNALASEEVKDLQDIIDAQIKKDESVVNSSEEKETEHQGPEFYETEGEGNNLQK